MKHVTHDVDFPEFAWFLSTSAPDDEFDRLATAYVAAFEQTARVRRRGEEADARRREIEQALMSADGKARSQLLAERAQVMQELDTAPAQRAEAVRQHAAAHLAWLARLDHLVRAEVERVNAALEPGRVEGAKIARALHQDDARYVGGPTLTVEERAALVEQQRKLGAAMRDDQGRLRRLQLVASVIQAKAQRYGDDVVLANSRTWEAAIARAGGHDSLLARAPVVKSLPHATRY